MLPRPSGTTRGKEKGGTGWGSLGGAPHPPFSCSVGHPRAGELRAERSGPAPCLALQLDRSYNTNTLGFIPVGLESGRAFHGKRRCQNGEVKAVQCFSGKGKTLRMEGGAWGISGARRDELRARLEIMGLGEGVEPGNIGEDPVPQAQWPPFFGMKSLEAA